MSGGEDRVGEHSTNAHEEMSLQAFFVQLTGYDFPAILAGSPNAETFLAEVEKKNSRGDLRTAFADASDHPERAKQISDNELNKYIIDNFDGLKTSAESYCVRQNTPFEQLPDITTSAEFTRSFAGGGGYRSAEFCPESKDDGRRHRGGQDDIASDVAHNAAYATYIATDRSLADKLVRAHITGDKSVRRVLGREIVGEIHKYLADEGVTPDWMKLKRIAEREYGARELESVRTLEDYANYELALGSGGFGNYQELVGRNHLGTARKRGDDSGHKR